jgi:membrane associated rhomboid family serine protease
MEHSAEFLNTTTIIIGLTVLISFYAWNKPDVMRRFIMNPYLVHTRSQYYRFITSGFIHKDHVHLLFNMISFYFFGRVMEQVFHTISNIETIRDTMHWALQGVYPLLFLPS